jgi:predicted lipoprotein with Yx(FWY)xxD motif
MSHALKFPTLASFAGLLLLVAPLPAADLGEPPLKRRNAIMVDVQGRGVYTYDLDKDPQRSSCDDMCRILWPPIVAAPDARASGRFSLVDRNDGRRQWAWDGKPLYRWISDRRRGEANGDGVAGVWTLVRLPCGDGDADVAPFTRAERPCPKP